MNFHWHCGCQNKRSYRITWIRILSKQWSSLAYCSDPEWCDCRFILKIRSWWKAGSLIRLAGRYLICFFSPYQLGYFSSVPCKLPKEVSHLNPPNPACPITDPWSLIEYTALAFPGLAIPFPSSLPISEASRSCHTRSFFSYRGICSIYAPTGT